MNVDKVKIMVPKFEKIEEWYHKMAKNAFGSLIITPFATLSYEKIPIPRRNRDISIALCISQ